MKAYSLLGHLDHFERREGLADGVIGALLLGEGARVGEQHPLVRHRDDIIVEGARGDGFGVLFDEYASVRVEPVHARHRAAGLFVLARGEAPSLASIDEHFDARA